MKKKKTTGSVEREKFLTELGVKYAKDLTEKATCYELEFKELLDKLGITYIFQYPVVYKQDKLMILDFYLPAYRLVFEIDGSQHYTKEGIKEDKRRTKKLNTLGFQVKRIQNSNVKHITIEMLSKYLQTQSQSNA